MIEALALVFFRQGFPIQPCSLQQGKGSEHIGACKCERVLDGTVHVAFGRKVDDAVHFFAAQQFQNSLEVTDVHSYETVVRLVLYVLEIRKITCVSEFVEVDDAVVGMVVYHQSHEMAPDKSGPSGDEYCLRCHISPSNCLCRS